MHKTRIVVILLIAMLLVLGGCVSKEASPPGEEVTPAAGEAAPPEEGAAGAGVPAEEEAVGAGVPAEEEAVGAGVPAEEEAAAPPSPEVVTVDVQLEIDSTNPEGVKFVAPGSGSYKITIVGGAYCYLSEEEEAWPIYGGWLTMLSLYINRPVEWGAPDEWGQHAINSDNIIGLEERYPTFAEAEATGQGLSVTVDLDKNGYVIVIVSDGSDYYFDNSGTITIRIVGYYQE